MKKTLLLFLFLNFCFSQSTDFSQGFGFAAGMPSGVGFSYRYIGESNGFQITLGAIGNGSDDNSFPDERTEVYDSGWVPKTDGTYTETSFDTEYFWGNLGIIYIRPFHRADKSMFYGFAGASANLSYDKYFEKPYEYVQVSDTEYTYRPAGDKKEVTDSEFGIFAGAGLGLSYSLTKNIIISMELPFTISDSGDIWMIVPQGSIHYFFK